eukprot:SAG31_NODE_2906_length_4924_cov_4.748187_5_plen_125_part_00
MITPLQTISVVLTLTFGWSLRSEIVSVGGSMVALAFACLGVTIAAAGRPAVRIGFVMFAIWQLTIIGCTTAMLVLIADLACPDGSVDLLCHFQPLLWTVGITNTVLGLVCLPSVAIYLDCLVAC